MDLFKEIFTEIKIDPLSCLSKPVLSSEGHKRRNSEEYLRSSNYIEYFYGTFWGLIALGYCDSIVLKRAVETFFKIYLSVYHESTSHTGLERVNDDNNSSNLSDGCV